MIAADVPAALLAIGIAALCVSTAISALSLPQWSLARRRRARAQLALPAVLTRRVVTGPPAALPAGAIPARSTEPPRPWPTPSDGRTNDHRHDQHRDQHHDHHDDHDHDHDHHHDHRRSHGPVEDIDEAAAVIDDLLEHDPERLAHTMTAWINEDTSTTWRPDRSDAR